MPSIQPFKKNKGISTMAVTQKTLTQTSLHSKFKFSKWNVKDYQWNGKG